MSPFFGFKPSTKMFSTFLEAAVRLAPVFFAFFLGFFLGSGPLTGPLPASRRLFLTGAAFFTFPFFFGPHLHSANASPAAEHGAVDTHRHWTNDRDWSPRPLCSKANPCDAPKVEKGGHKYGVRGHKETGQLMGPQTLAERYRMPPALLKEIFGRYENIVVFGSVERAVD